MYVPTLCCSLCILCHFILIANHWWQGVVLCPTLEMRKLRVKKVKRLLKSLIHLVSSWMLGFLPSHSDSMCSDHLIWSVLWLPSYISIGKGEPCKVDMGIQETGRYNHSRHVGYARFTSTSVFTRQLFCLELHTDNCICSA